MYTLYTSSVFVYMSLFIPLQVYTTRTCRSNVYSISLDFMNIIMIYTPNIICWDMHLLFTVISKQEILILMLNLCLGNLYKQKCYKPGNEYAMFVVEDGNWFVCHTYGEREYAYCYIYSIYRVE